MLFRGTENIKSQIFTSWRPLYAIKYAFRILLGFKNITQRCKFKHEILLLISFAWIISFFRKISKYLLGLQFKGYYNVDINNLVECNVQYSHLVRVLAVNLHSIYLSTIFHSETWMDISYMSRNFSFIC